MIGSQAIGGVPQLPQKVSPCSACQCLTLTAASPAMNDTLSKISPLAYVCSVSEGTERWENRTVL